MCIVKTQKLASAKAAEKGQEYEVTEHETIKTLKINKEEYTAKVNKAVVDFQQKNGFEELTAEIKAYSP